MRKKLLRRKSQFIVAIGASAGGLEAIHEFFDHMPESDNISFVVVQHLSADYKSLLVELVSKHTKMRVFEAGHDMPVVQNCIYVIPNNKFITIRDNHLMLTEKETLRAPNNAIDVFMHTLAHEKKHEAIAVILSGTGTDGTRGIASIKEEGGLVIVQEPASSKFNGMPNSAIESGYADFILPPDEIAGQIAKYVTDDEIPSEETISDEVLQRFFSRIHDKANLDFHLYKTPTIIRRILHRMKKGNFPNVGEYLDFIEKDEGEAALLGREFLINVTRFFRDRESYDALRDTVLPEIVRSKAEGEEIKIWVCACSTGEEAYSLAIVMDEVLCKLNSPGFAVRIFATDIEKSSLEFASKGFYPKTIAGDVGAQRLKTYFTEYEGGYLIIPRIRRQIVFAVHNVIKNPPFIKNDLVSCRNMLIYMNPSLQERVYSILLFALKLNGYLFLGSTENPGPVASHLEEVSVRQKIFQKVSEARRHPYLPDVSRRAPVQRVSENAAPAREAPVRLQDELRETLLEDFDFTAFYIDRNFDIRDAVGNYNQILSLPQKNLRLNLLRMLPAGISAVLAREVRGAWKDGRKRKLTDLMLERKKSYLALDVAIRPDERGLRTDLTLVAIHFRAVSPGQPAPGPAPESSDQHDYIFALEEELHDTKASLQHAIEDLETANEELQSSNEELLSSNEELQSSNEELQSLNEELHTLNTEHQLKIRELIELNDDLNNYFRSSNVGQIFLDENLRIRRFTPASTQLINVIETDIGRPISHISTNIKYNGFIRDIESVLQTKETIEQEVELYSGLNMLVRIMPYVTGDRRMSGVIIAFVDITTVTGLTNIVRGVFNASQNAIFALQAVRNRAGAVSDFLVLASNLTANQLIGTDTDNLKGALLKRDGHAAFFQGMFAHFVRVVDRGMIMHDDFYYEQEGKWLAASAVKMMDGLVVTLADVTQKKNSEERLKKNYAELIRTKEHLKALNAELEIKVADRTQLLSTSEERFRLVARATNDVIWDWDLVKNSIWFSDALFLRFGHRAPDGFRRHHWLEQIHPDEKQKVSDDISRAINSRAKQWSMEYRFRKANGEYANILDRAYVMHDEHGMPFRMLGSMLDLTELRRAQQEIEESVAERKFLAQSMPLIVWTANAGGEVDFVNTQFHVYTGIRTEEALGNGWLKAIHAEDLPDLERSWRDAVEFKSDLQMEIRLQVAGGLFRWNILRAKVLKNPDANPVSWVITTIDIHEQKLNHEFLEQKVDERTRELLRINEALEVSNHDLQQFASVASHDLQEPLRKIHLYADLIKDRFSKELGGGAGYVEKILQSSVRMKSIISNILNYSRLSAENVGFVLTDLNQMLQEIMDDLEIGIQEKGAVIRIDELPIVETVPGQMRQVFQNMIVNSLKFSRPGVTPDIRITGETIDEKDFESPVRANGKFARIVLRDNGIGFDSKFARQVFVLFQRLHPKDVFEGTGIGLAIVKKIIEKHHGIIRAHGKEGEGATFVIVLPRLQNRHENERI